MQCHGCGGEIKEDFMSWQKQLFHQACLATTPKNLIIMPSSHAKQRSALCDVLGKDEQTVILYTKDPRPEMEMHQAVFKGRHALVGLR